MHMCFTSCLHFIMINFVLEHFNLPLVSNYLINIIITVVKLDKSKTSSRRKMRKAHFGASSVERARRMSASLSKDLSQKYNVRAVNSALPIMLKIFDAPISRYLAVLFYFTKLLI